MTQTLAAMPRATNQLLSLDAWLVYATMVIGIGALDGVGTVGPTSDGYSGIVTPYFLAASIYAAFQLYSLRHEFLALTSKASMLILLVALACASLAWSIDPLITIKRSLALVGTTILGMYFALRFTPQQFFRLAGIGLAGACAVTCLAVIINPVFAIHHDEHYPAMRGWFLHKNVLGNCMALASVFPLMLLADKQTRGKGAALLLAVAALVIVSLSRTAWVELAVILGTSGLIIFLRHLRMAGWVMVTGAALIAAILISDYGWDNALQNLGVMLDRDATISGRTEIWRGIIDIAAPGHMWLGYGYDAFWNGANGGAASIPWGMGSKYVPPHAHNGFLQTFSHIGLVGVAVMCLSLFPAFLRNFAFALKSPNSSYAFGAIFLAGYLAINLVEGFYLAQNRFMWVLYVYAVFFPFISKRENA